MIFNAAAIAGLREKLPGLAAQCAANVRRAQAPGAEAKAAGRWLDANPHRPGCWRWTKWLEGWSGTEAPERDAAGGGFNMTPAEELARRLEWLRGLGVSEEHQAEAALLIRRSYRPDAIGTVQ